MQIFWVISDGNARAFNRPGVSQTVALDLSNAFEKVFQIRYLALFYLFSAMDNFEWLLMASLYKKIQLVLACEFPFWKNLTCFIYLTSLITLVLVVWKWVGLFLRKYNLLRGNFCKSGTGGDSLKFRFLSFLDIW